MGAEESLHHGDNVSDARHDGVTCLGVIDGETHNVSQPPRSVIPQERHPSAEGAGHACSEQAGTGDVVQAERADQLDGGRLWRRALTADDLNAASSYIPEQDWDLPAESVQVRLHHLQDEAGGEGGLACITALLEHRHPALSGEPVR